MLRHHSKSLPPFLWLLRDFQFAVVDENGMKITPTDFLRYVVLKEDEFKVCDAIEKFFVSFECQVLPPPTTDPEVVANLDKHKAKVSVMFWSKLDSLVIFLKSVVKPRKIFDGSCVVDGPTLATLVEETTKAINYHAHCLPALNNSVVNSRCQVVLYELLEEYNSTMRQRYEEASKDRPLEEVRHDDLLKKDRRETLMGIHHGVSDQLMEELKQRFGWLLSSTIQVSMKKELQGRLAQYNLETSSPLTEKVNKLVGGALYPFVEENKRRSHKYCQDLFVRLYNPIKSKVLAANESGYVLKDLEDDIEQLWKHFNDQAIGPQKLQARHQGLQTIKDDMKMFETHLKMCDELLTSIKERQQEQEKYEQLKEVVQELADGKERQEKEFADLIKQQREAEIMREKTDEEIRIKIGKYEEQECLRQEENRCEMETENQKRRETEKIHKKLQQKLQRRKEEEERQAKDRKEIETLQCKLSEETEKLKRLKEVQAEREKTKQLESQLKVMPKEKSTN